MKRMGLGAVALALLVLDILLEWTGVAAGLVPLVTLGVVMTGILPVCRVVRQMLRQSIWRLRNRLIVTYVFIGVVPIVLILALAVVGTWIVVGQVAVYLISSQLERQAAALENPARFLTEATPEEREPMVRQLATLFGERMRGFEVLVTGAKTLRYPAESRLSPPPRSFPAGSSYILKEGHYFLSAVARRGPDVAVVMVPLTEEFLNRLVPGMGLLSLNAKRHRVVAGRVPPMYNGVDFPVTWFNQIRGVEWETGALAEEVILLVQTRPSAVLASVFGGKMDDSQNALLIFMAIASALLVFELAAIVIGVSLTRSITGAVEGLYEGTQRISAGDFGYRIPIQGGDQLAELGQSFNNMTTQLETLLVVAKEKERLSSEIQIASEVQNRLFPRSAPELRTIELTGTCQPARMVSGDYYDYLCLPNGNLALAIGDVAGKGISAALLMASIQSIVRLQLAAGPGAEQARFSTSKAVEQLNRQLYASTSSEKYATFFFGIYDETTRELCYTNAGHLQPLLVRSGVNGIGGGVEMLEVTGTVVGAFPAVRYEERTVRLEPGDLLIAYTDGITEPENAYGEEFGAERLAEVAQLHQKCEPAEIATKILEAVTHWSAAPELPDDMTVVLARGRA